MMGEGVGEQMERKKKMKKLCALAILLLVGTILVGCSIMKNAKRQEYEERFSRISEVYPTAKAEDLFKKFPKGFRIVYRREERTNNKTFFHEFKLRGDHTTKQIIGDYTKVRSQPYNDEIIMTSTVTYSDKNGFQTTDDQVLDSSLENVRFLFTQLPIDYQYLKSLDLDAITESPVTGNYSIRYEITNENINSYINLPKGSKTLLEFRGYPKYDKQDKYFLTLSVERSEKYYFSETVIEE
ncbi:hypothetical protein [Streptococcus sanguinis]|nr:hypothetical protein [Streptococcus sanguinis]